MLSHFIMWLLKDIKRSFCWHDYEHKPANLPDCVPEHYKCKKCGRISIFGLE